jgi:hypothetical protein
MLHLVDTSGDLVDEHRRVFGDVDEVACSDADVLAVAQNAIVSPGNSYGCRESREDKAQNPFATNGRYNLFRPLTALFPDTTGSDGALAVGLFALL